MYLTEAEVQKYNEEGYLLLYEKFSQAEVDRMKEEMGKVFDEDSPRRVLEKDGKTVRSVYGSHFDSEVFRQISVEPRLVLPAMQILDDKIYVYQFKINAKLAFKGDVWEWHQDFIFWHNEDGMPSPKVINVVVFLDEVTEYNGPLLFIPRSHTYGLVDVASKSNVDSENNDSRKAWISNLTADLKYSLTKETVAELTHRYGIVAPKGPAGTVLLFHSNIAHGSSPNMSPFDRTLLIVTYNSINNVLKDVDNPRPDFLACRNYEPIELTGTELLPL